MTSTALFSLDVPGAGPHLAVLTARAYRLVPSGRAQPLGTEVDLLASLTKTAEDDEGPLDDSETSAALRPLTDVLLRGSAHSRGRTVRSLDTGVEVGRATKTVRAVGERRIRVGLGGRLEMTSPLAFESIALTWANAYGGCDDEADAEMRSAQPGFGRGNRDDDLGSLSYPRNRWGRGFYVDLKRERLEGALLPNLDDPNDPVSPDRLLATDAYDWLDRPAAACYEPMDLFTFPRVAFMILPTFTPPTHPVYELSKGALLRSDLAEKKDFAQPDIRVFNCAPAGLAVCRLLGNERLKLWNVHPRHELLECDLPGDRPRVFIEPPGCPQRELEPLLQTLLIEPDDDRITLTWTARLPTAAEFPEDVLTKVRHGVAWVRG